jgi:hypothetical protein
MKLSRNSLSRTFLAVACLLALLVPTVSSALTIGFEGVALPGAQTSVGNNYVEAGFNFFNPGSTGDAAIVGQPSQNTSGSDYYTWNSPPANNPVVLTALSGSVFDFASLDVGSKNFASAAIFDITGFLSGGGTVVANVVGVTNIQTLVLGWTNLTKVEFQYISGNFGAIDNLAVVPIPEPSAFIVFGIGAMIAGGAAATRRRAA